MRIKVMNSRLGCVPRKPHLDDYLLDHAVPKP